MKNKLIRFFLVGTLAMSTLFCSACGSDSSSTGGSSTASAAKEETAEQGSDQNSANEENSSSADDQSTSQSAAQEETKAEPVFPEYKLAEITSYQFMDMYFYVYTLENVAVGDSFSSVKVCYEGEEYYQYTYYYGSVCEYPDLETWHDIDMEQNTFVIRSETELDPAAFSFTASYWDSVADASIEDHPLEVNCSADDITTMQTYMHGSSLFKVNGTYMVRDNGASGTSWSEDPVAMEAYLYDFIVLADEETADAAMQYMCDHITLLSGEEDSLCQPYEFSAGEELFVEFDKPTYAEDVYTLRLGAQKQGSYTDEEREIIDRTHFMITEEGASEGLTVYTWNK